MKPFFLQILEQMGLGFSLGDMLSHAASLTSASEVSTSSEISGPGFCFWPNSYAGNFPFSFFLYIFSVRIRKLAALSYWPANIDPVVLWLCYVGRQRLLETSAACCPLLSIFHSLNVWLGGHDTNLRVAYIQVFNLCWTQLSHVMWGLSTGKHLEKELCRKEAGGSWRTPSRSCASNMPLWQRWPAAPSAALGRALPADQGR